MVAWMTSITIEKTFTALGKFLLFLLKTNSDRWHAFGYGQQITSLHNKQLNTMVAIVLDDREALISVITKLIDSIVAGMLGLKSYPNRPGYDMISRYCCWQHERAPATEPWPKFAPDGPFLAIWVAPRYRFDQQREILRPANKSELGMVRVSPKKLF